MASLLDDQRAVAQLIVPLISVTAAALIAFLTASTRKRLPDERERQWRELAELKNIGESDAAIVRSIHRSHLSQKVAAQAVPRSEATEDLVADVYASVVGVTVAVLVFEANTVLGWAVLVGYGICQSVCLAWSHWNVRDNARRREEVAQAFLAEQSPLRAPVPLRLRRHSTRGAQLRGTIRFVTLSGLLLALAQWAAGATIWFVGQSPATVMLYVVLTALTIGALAAIGWVMSVALRAEGRTMALRSWVVDDELLEASALSRGSSSATRTARRRWVHPAPRRSRQFDS